jgi:hypothetical protein
MGGKLWCGSMAVFNVAGGRSNICLPSNCLREGEKVSLASWKERESVSEGVLDLISESRQKFGASSASI